MLFRIILTAWFVLAGLSAAHADPFSLIIGIGSWIAGAGALVQSLLVVAIEIGVSLIQKAMADTTTATEPGIQGDIAVGGDNPLSFIMGSFATAGQLEYVNTWGNVDKTPNAYITHVISLSDLPLHALTGLWVNDKKVTLPNMGGAAPVTQGYPVADFNADGQDYLWIKFHDGSQTSVDTFLGGIFGSDAVRPWSTDMIGRGVPYVTVTARLNQKLFSGIPSYLFETDGILLYDIRKDSTAGGSGSHRWATPSTWEISDNPIVHTYNIVRGVSYAGTWLYGGQTTLAYQLPAATWMAAMNVCDTAIPLAAGGTEKQYRAGCQITTDQPPADVIDSLLKGCSGRLSEVGGMYKVIVGAPGAAVYSFTDDNIVVTEGQSFDPFPGLEQTYNGAQASYPEPAEKWASKDAPAYLRADLEVLDDNRRLVTGLTFPTVPYAVQIQRLLQEAIQDSRRFRQHQFYLPPETWLLEPGDVVSWSSARNSYTNKKFLITSIEGGSNFLQLVSLKEVDPNDFTWNPATDQKPYSVGPIGPILPPVQAMTGWQVFPAVIVDSTSLARRPSIEVRFDGDLDDVQFARVQVRLASSAAIIFDGALPYGDPATNTNPRSIVLNGTFLPKADYEASGRFLTFSGRDTSQSAWLPVTTDDIRLGIGDFYPISLAQLAQDLKDWQTYTGNAVRDVLDELRAVSASVSGNMLVGMSDKQQLRTEVWSTTDGAVALFRNEITIATGPGSALVTSITTLQATVNDPVTGVVATNTTTVALSSTVTTQGGLITSANAAITALQNTVNDPSTGVVVTSTAVSSLTTTVTSQGGTISANSSAITALQTSVGDVSAGATFRMGTGYTPAAGWSSRIGIEARVTSGGTFRSSGFYLEATTTASRIIMDTDQLVIMTGGVVTALFDSGTAYIANARIRNLTAGNIVANSLDAGVVMQNGTIITSLIAGRAITDFDTQSFNSGSVSAVGGPTTRNTTATVSNISGVPVLVFAQMNNNYTQGLGGNPSGIAKFELFRTVSGVDTLVKTITYSSQSGIYEPVFLDAGAPTGNYTYKMVTTTTSMAGGSAVIMSGGITTIWWKK